MNAIEQRKEAKQNRFELFRSFILFTALFLLCIVADAEIIPDRFPVRMISSLYFFVLLVSLTYYFTERIADRGRLRRWLITCTYMLILFILLRAVKYEGFSPASVWARYTWYLYYLPMLFVPLCTLYATLSINDNAGKTWKGIRILLGTITTSLFLLVLTNDLHQSVFQFQPNFENWDAEYLHQPCYYVIITWIYILGALALITMVQKCRLSAAKKDWWIPTIPYAIGFFLQLLIAIGKMPRINGLMILQFPEVNCYATALFWECCIRIGLLPTNKGHGELMKVCSLALQITDKQGTPVWRSISAAQLTEEQKKLEGSGFLNEDTELYREAIPGGYVFWQNDISEINATNRELEEVHARLSEETELIRLENELKEKQIAIAQRSKLYELIARKTLSQSNRITQLAQEAMETSDPDKRRKHAALICFFGAYVKRYANLILLAENSTWMSLTELGLAIVESLRYLGNAGIPADFLGSVDQMIPSEKVILLYEAFERIIEDSLGDLRAVYVTTQSREREILLKLTLEGSEKDLDEVWVKELAESGLRTAYEKEDGVSYVQILL